MNEHAFDGNGFCQIHGRYCSMAAEQIGHRTAPALYAVCKHCHRPLNPIHHLPPERVWQLLFVEYERIWLCDARTPSMERPHEPAEAARALRDGTLVVPDASLR